LFTTIYNDSLYSRFTLKIATKKLYDVGFGLGGSFCAVTQ